jgi:tetratricopeptide (TPR) repeat protein
VLPAAPDEHETHADHGDRRKEPSGPPSQPRIQRPAKVRRPSRLGKWLKSLKLAVVVKGYDYWVACALAEEDPAMKVEYLSKALKVNPSYLPAWGLKGTALLGLERYGEALECFDKSLEMHPSAIAWHRKGVCCYHLDRREEARQCFDKALEMCPTQDHELAEETARMKSLLDT